MEENDIHTLENYTNESISEPGTYSILLKKRKISPLKHEDINSHTLNSHSVMKDSKLVANQINKVLIKKINKKKIKFIDVGCGLGFISNEIGKLIGYENTYCCDPAPSTKEFIKLQFPQLNYIHCDAQTIPDKFNNFFDTIYCGEIYIFTRTNNIQVHRKNLESLFKKLKPKGIIIVELIKGEKREDIFTNLKELNYKYEIKIPLPQKLINNKLFIFIHNISYPLSNFLIKVVLKMIGLKTRYQIIFYQ